MTVGEWTKLLNESMPLLKHEGELNKQCWSHAGFVLVSSLEINSDNEILQWTIALYDLRSNKHLIEKVITTRPRFALKTIRSAYTYQTDRIKRANRLKPA